MKKAVILLSGGLDSTTCLAIAKKSGFACYALSFDYGQRHSAELIAAKQIARQFAVVEHKIIALNFNELGGSALTDSSLAIPNHQTTESIPNTYVPARNSIFLAIALGFAEVIQSRDIFIGVSAIDYSHYPDCRPEFITAFQKMANLATKAGIEGETFTIHAPLQFLSKAETIRKGMSLGVDYGLTVSCYQLKKDGKICGSCDSCCFRQKGFFEAGIADPALLTNGTFR